MFRDTIAPIDALMKVGKIWAMMPSRVRAARFFPEKTPINQAPLEHGPRAARATALGPIVPSSNESCIDHAEDAAAHLHIVEIQDQTYGLALGWKISQTSFDVVSWMLGKPKSAQQTACTCRRRVARGRRISAGRDQAGDTACRRERRSG